MSEKKAKNNIDWKKRVKAEYFRLLQAKKTKKDDDNELAFMNNQKKLYGMYQFFKGFVLSCNVWYSPVV